jgi:hypothetical protein
MAQTHSRNTGMKRRDFLKLSANAIGALGAAGVPQSSRQIEIQRRVFGRSS